MISNVLHETKKLQNVAIRLNESNHNKMIRYGNVYKTKVN